MKTIYNIALGAEAELGSAGAYYRSILPSTHLMLKNIKMVPGANQLDPVCDAYIIPRSISHTAIPIIEGLRQKGKKIIFDIDDNIWNIPLSNPTHKVYTKEVLADIEWLMSIADFITVSNQNMANLINKPNVRILPNLIDMNAYQRQKKVHKGILILYTCSNYHQEELEYLVPIVKELINYPQVKFVFFGDFPSALEKFNKRILYVPPIHISQYSEVLCELNCDFALLPLSNTPFNNTKSNIKFLETVLSGSLAITNNQEVYPDAIYTTNFLSELAHYIVDNKDYQDKLEEQHHKACLKYSVQHNKSWQSFVQELFPVIQERKVCCGRRKK
jgi:hypothetical protein